MQILASADVLCDDRPVKTVVAITDRDVLSDAFRARSTLWTCSNELLRC